MLAPEAIAGPHEVADRQERARSPSCRSIPFGVESGRILPCPSRVNPNCVSTSSLNDAYVPAWRSPIENSTQAAEEIKVRERPPAVPLGPATSPSNSSYYYCPAESCAGCAARRRAGGSQRGAGGTVPPVHHGRGWVPVWEPATDGSACGHHMCVCMLQVHLAGTGSSSSSRTRAPPPLVTGMGTGRQVLLWTMLVRVSQPPGECDQQPAGPTSHLPVDRWGCQVHLADPDPSQRRRGTEAADGAPTECPGLVPHRLRVDRVLRVVCC